MKKFIVNSSAKLQKINAFSSTDLKITLRSTTKTFFCSISYSYLIILNEKKLGNVGLFDEDVLTKIGEEK